MSTKYCNNGFTSSTDMEDFEGFSNNSLVGTGTVNNMFELYVSRTNDNISIIFFQQSTHAKVLQLLQSMYQLNSTKDKTGLTTTITMEGKKVCKQYSITLQEC